MNIGGLSGSISITESCMKANVDVPLINFVEEFNKMPSITLFQRSVGQPTVNHTFNWVKQLKRRVPKKQGMEPKILYHTDLRDISNQRYSCKNCIKQRDRITLVPIFLKNRFNSEVVIVIIFFFF